MGTKWNILAVFTTLLIVSETYKMCDDVSPPEHSNLRVASNNFYYIVECHSGYSISGNSVVYCRGGQWESAPPKCVENTTNVCPELTAPENGEMKCDQGPLFMGAACRFHCSDGFRLSGVNMRRCMTRLQWSGKEPKCLPVTDIFCPVPPPLTNGTIIGCSPVKVPRVGTTCNFRCNPGYILKGPSALHCRQNAKLTDFEGKELMPKCVATGNPSTLNVGNGNVGGDSSQDHLSDDQSSLKQDVTVECQPNFYGPNCHSFCKPRDDASGHYTCDKDGQKICITGYTGAFCRIGLNNCEMQPCKNGGTCENTSQGSYNCACTDDYMGRNCTKLKNLCRKNLCLNGGTCQNSGPGRYTCHCLSSFRGPRCELRNKCDASPCQNHGTCVPYHNGFFCRCAEGFSGERCQTKEFCEHGTSGCEPICTYDGCNCKPGYVFSIQNRVCYDVDECSIETLNRCQYNCHNTDGGYTCSCPAGYRQIDDYSCEELCVRGTAGCGPICIQAGRCRCNRGYALSVQSGICYDIDECSDETRNRCQYNCHNTDGGYTCSCPAGYRQIDDYRCEGCKKNSYWLEEKEQCVNCPDNSFTTAGGMTSIRDCICLDGYYGNPEENIPCQDINECVLGNFGCSHKCVNTPGSAFCSCPLGYTLDFHNKTCVDIDECSIKNGGCEGICHNTDGGFQCSCPEGYMTSNRDHYSCDDVNECLQNNGGCEHKCNNYPGGFYCSCDDGFRLDGGLQNCSDIRCPAFPVPHFSTVRCKINGNIIQDLESYPIGSVCDLKCNTGFKSTDKSNRIQCQNDGTWKGTLSECKSQKCNALAVPENGDIHPPSCAKEGNTVKQSCTFTCRTGYQLKGSPVFRCKNNLTWSVAEIPICQPVKAIPIIKCPEDISLDLLPGKDTHNVTIPAPTTNVESLQIQPDWVSTDVLTEFPAGKTDITFKASSPTSNRSAECITSVQILDKEAPVFNFCPDSIEIEGAGADGVSVMWDSPVVSDNVEVVSLHSTLEQNSTLTPGTYIVEYIAKDAAGNIASCSFDINVTSTQCSDLEDPTNGEANCMHWLFGKICRPLCDPGYARHPKDAVVLYTCDDTGIWEPSDSINACLPSVPAVSSTCPDEYELTENSETGEEICVECPKNTIWSLSSKKCEDTT